MAKNKILRTREAGDLVEQVLYTRVQAADDERARGAKRKRTTEIMQKYNDKSSVKKLELWLAANFRKGDLVGCLTYDDRHLPGGRAEANRRVKYFRQKLAEHYRRRGVELIMFWNVEHVHGEGRWHHHFVLPSTGFGDYEAIRAAWPYGSDIELDRLRVDREKNYATLAAYYAKEAREKLGLRSWSHTRNAKAPVVEVERVESDYQLQAPRGVEVLERISIETAYGCYQYLKYMRPQGFKPRRRGKKNKSFL